MIVLPKHKASEPIGHHITLRLADSRVIATRASDRRALSASIRRVGEPVGLCIYRAVDTHLHLVMCGARVLAGECARRIEIGLQRSLDLRVPFAPSHLKPIEDQRHLMNLPSYLFNQESHHGTNTDPLHDASSLPDLLGARVGACWQRARLLEIAPRITDEMLWRHFPDFDTSVTLGEEALPFLMQAAAAATCLPDLSPVARTSRLARAAAIRVALHQRMGTHATIADALGITRRPSGHCAGTPSTGNSTARSSCSFGYEVRSVIAEPAAFSGVRRRTGTTRYSPRCEAARAGPWAALPSRAPNDRGIRTGLFVAGSSTSRFRFNGEPTRRPRGKTKAAASVDGGRFSYRLQSSGGTVVRRPRHRGRL